MKKLHYLITAVLLIALISLTSCYTKKRGVVPCPHGYNINNIENIDIIPFEKA